MLYFIKKKYVIQICAVIGDKSSQVSHCVLKVKTQNLKENFSLNHQKPKNT